MFSTTGAIHDLKTSTRCVASIRIPSKYRENNKHWFIVGSLCLGGPNEDAVQGKETKQSGLILVEYSEDSNSISHIPVRLKEEDLNGNYTEIWSLSTHPVNPNLLFVICTEANSEGVKRYANLCRLHFSLVDSYDEDSKPECEVECTMETLYSLDVDEEKHGHVREILWCPTEENESPTDSFMVDSEANDYESDFDTGDSVSYRGSSTVVTVHDKVLLYWDLEREGNSYTHVCNKREDNDQKSFMGASWDPHHTNEVAVGYGCDVLVYDIRTSEGLPIRRIPSADSARVRVVDHNPNKPFYLVTSGDDGNIKFWDVRHKACPVRVLSGHSHWVCQVKYNKSHDQLVISAGTDASVSLWRVSSISSAPLLDLLAEEENEKPNIPLKESDNSDSLIKTIDDHFDSVYGVVWSCNDAWIYASISYDGRICISHVPSAEKYKILL